MSKQSPLFFRLPESTNLSLRNQVCELISSAITMKSLWLDRPLPSCRLLAEQLGVSRNTVFAAYSQLFDLEVLVARDRSGFYVNPDIYRNADIPAPGTSDAGKTPAPVQFARTGMIPIDNSVDWTRYPYPFTYNQIDPNLFPVDERRHYGDWEGDLVAGKQGSGTEVTRVKRKSRYLSAAILK